MKSGKGISEVLLTLAAPGGGAHYARGVSLQNAKG